MAATRLLATAGAGGIALTVWAPRRSGMGRRALLTGLTTFYAALYGIFMAALALAGTGPWTGPLPGGLGGVEGGMIGAFLAFGVDAGLAVAAVLAYAPSRTGSR